jgi:hypothetical protein
VIVNKNLLKLIEYGIPSNGDMVQFSNYDIYKNDVSIGSPVAYSKNALNIIKGNMGDLDKNRPETSAWRFIEKKGLIVMTHNAIVGMHGFGQDDETMTIAEKNKVIRKQIDLYDFDLAYKLKELYEK